MSKVYFDITVDHDEMTTLEAALTQYLAVCERELANEVYSPFYAHQCNIECILARRYDKVHTHGFALSQADRGDGSGRPTERGFLKQPLSSATSARGM